MVEVLDDTVPVEQCAVLYGRHVGGNIEVLAFEFVPNRHPTPEDAYRILLSDIAPHHREHIVGVFHTHLEGHDVAASSVDIDTIQPGHVGIVYHLPTGTITVFTSQQDKEKQ